LWDKQKIKMAIPNLPTDSLYKFMAITGLIILIACLFYPNYQAEKFAIESIRLGTEIDRLEYQIEDIKKVSMKINDKIIEIRKEYDSDKKANKLDSIDKDYNLLRIIENCYNKNYRDSHEFLYKYKNELIRAFG
jgi:hypothetical protein